MTKKAALTGLAALTLAAMVATPTYARRGSDDGAEDDSRVGDRGSRYDDDFDSDGIEDDLDQDDDNDGIKDGSDGDDHTATSTAAKAQLKLLKKEREGRNGAASSTLDTADLGCLSTAVAEREDALLAALDAFDADAKTALTERKGDLADAYAKTDRKEVKDAVKSAWKTYKDAMKTARAELKSDKKTAYKAFKDEAKTCGGSVSAESTDTSAPGEEILL